MNPMGLSKALLEDWMREYYFSTELDLGSSGVEDYSMAEVRELSGLTLEELDALVFHDSETQGNFELRQVIARRFVADADPEQVMITHGSTESNFMLMHTLLRPGDEVVVLDPCYQQLAGIAAAIGCRVRHWTLRRDQEFQPNLDDLAAVLTDRTRMVVVNFPHNPTGATLTHEQQAELISMIRPSGAYLIWDAAFESIQYGSGELPSPSRFYERAISMGTLSKCYGLPGLRLGWSVGPAEVFRRCFQLRDYTTLHLSPLVELVARRVLENGEKFVTPRWQQAKHNLALLEAWAEDHQEWVDWFSPRGGVTAFPRLTQVEDSEDFCRHFGQIHKVLLVPGSCFRYPQHVRLGFGGATDRFEEGLGRLSRCLEEFSQTPMMSFG